MATVTVEVNGRPYAVGCADGQEERVRILAKQFDNQVRQVAQDVGHVGDLRLFLMSALILSDELHEARLNGTGAVPDAPGRPIAQHGRRSRGFERRGGADRKDRPNHLITALEKAARSRLSCSTAGPAAAHVGGNISSRP
jgi:cell division protein ZapA